MTSLTVRALPATGAAAHSGAEFTFGGDASVDLPLPGTAGVLGRVSAGAAHWSVSNYSRDIPLVVEDARDGQGYATVRPGATAVPVPFAHARVVILSCTGVVGFTVDSDLYDLPAPECSPGSLPLLDTTAKYFAVLVALCEPALRYGSAALIPTTREIAHALRHACGGITVEAVQYHLHYLLNVKLRAHVDHHCALRGVPRTGRRDQYRRAVLVDLALRFGLVRPAHLRVLAPDS